MELIYAYAPYGAFIQGISGTLYTVDEWNNQETANGVAVITENCSFVMALQDAIVSNPIGLYDGAACWGGNGTLVDGVLATTSLDVAITDYAGQSNTEKIIAQLKGVNDGYVTGAQAANAAANYTFPNGQKGYLGAAGEWQAVVDNLDAIEAALSACGVSTFSEIYYSHWTSTQEDLSGCWAFVYHSHSLQAYGRYDKKYGGCFVRAFTTL